MARAIATRCCWPPESSPGVWCSRPAQPDALQRLQGQRRDAPARHAAIDQRQLDIFDGGRAWQQVEALEYEAEEMPPQQRALVAVELPDLDALEQVFARWSAYRGSR